MSNEARKPEPDCKEIAKNIDAMNERELRRYCRMIEMIGLQQMDSIRHKNDVIAELMADNQKLEQQLAFEHDRHRDYQEHKATMFALVTFGILMITGIVCIVSMAVL